MHALGSWHPDSLAVPATGGQTGKIYLACPRSSYLCLDGDPFRGPLIPLGNIVLLYSREIRKAHNWTAIDADRFQSLRQLYGWSLWFFQSEQVHSRTLIGRLLPSTSWIIMYWFPMFILQITFAMHLEISGLSYWCAYKRSWLIFGNFGPLSVQSPPENLKTNPLRLSP